MSFYAITVLRARNINHIKLPTLDTAWSIKSLNLF